MSQSPSVDLQARAQDLPALRTLLDDATRLGALHCEGAGLYADFSRQRVRLEDRDALLRFAEAQGLFTARDQLFQANQLNGTEERAVLHTALRRPRGAPPLWLEGENISEAIGEALARMAELADAIRSGRWRGATGASITDVLHIGIGGSYLGPALACEALGPPTGPTVHFLANVDGAAAQHVLADLDPTRTLLVIASKSFSTLETLVNAQTVRRWFLARGLSEGQLKHHCLAVTTNHSAAAAFGIPPEQCLPLWDWVGGRFSLWSPIGLPVALSHGMEAFQALLGGAHAMDEHFQHAAPEENLPVLLALFEYWNQQVLGTQSHAFLPYAEALTQLPAYLQQLEMESNGKSTTVAGAPVEGPTGTILWGTVGTNGQHATHQLLHQGTQPFSATFVLARRGAQGLADHHRWLRAHCIAQAEAFARGLTTEEAERALLAKGADPEAAARLAPHKRLPGNHPSNLLIVDQVDAESLGALLALHEHKVFCHGMLWGINSFDQWGVEFGKVLGDTLYAAQGETALAETLGLSARASLAAALGDGEAR
jgi:glucose-6-phosphate isomerase